MCTKIHYDLNAVNNMNCTGIELRNFRSEGLFRPDYLACLPPQDSQCRKACVADGFEA